MVVGAYPSSYYYLAEVVDLSGNNVPCASVSSYPSKYGSVGAFVDDMVLVCGGDSDVTPSTASCFSYDWQVQYAFGGDNLSFHLITCFS